MSRLMLLLHIASSLCHALLTSSDSDATSKIVKYENFNDGSGSYYFSYETSNGISREEKGTLVDSGLPSAHIDVQGIVSFTDPNGKLISFRYSADKNGYHVLPLLPVTVTPHYFSAPAVITAVPPSVLASLLGG